MMTLKRLLATALGALGLWALGVAPASAQQIPAPDAYENPLACQNALPVGPPMRPSTKHPLDDAIKAGMLGDLEATLTFMAEACLPDTDPVGGGIAKARTLYNAVVDAQADVDAAQMAYDDDDSAGNLEDLNEAKMTRDMAVMARNNFAGGMAGSEGIGAVYQSVFDEEKAKADATAAHSAWMTALEAETVAEELKDLVSRDDFISSFAGFDSDGNPLTFELYERAAIDLNDDGDTDDSGEFAATTFVRVKKADGTYVGTDEAGNAPELTVNAFDHEADIINADDTLAEGELVALRLETWDPDGADGDAEAQTIVVVTTDTEVLANVMFGDDTTNDVDGVDSRYMDAKDAYETAQENNENNVDGTRDAALAEAERRAKARYDHFKAQRDAAYDDLRKGRLSYTVDGDNPDTTEIETSYMVTYSDDDYDSLMDLQGDEASAAAALKRAYDDRIAKSNAVESSQRDTEAYLEQLVKLREYDKAQADAAAEDADADDLNDDGLTADQVAANMALANAQGQQTAFNDVQALPDGHPIKNLVNGLLAADNSMADDDGQTLVDAISDTYQTANDAETKANNAMNAVSGLTREDGAVAQNTGRVESIESELMIDSDGNGTIMQDDGTSISRLTDIENKLALKKEYIGNLGTHIGVDPVTGLGTGPDGMSRIDINQALSEANRDEIGMDENGMSRIDHNQARSEANAAEIGVDEDGNSRIDHNEARSQANYMEIGMDADGMSRIDHNQARSMDNATDIMAIRGMVDTNSSGISSNRMAIARNSEAIETLRSGVAASMALAGMPEIGDRGVSVGAASYDGESAFAVGVHFSGENSRFKLGVTSSGGETGASVGAGWSF